MKFMGVQSQRMIFASIAAISVLVFSVAPLSASAAEVNALTVQLAPAGAVNTCAPVTATDFKAYVYDGAINSFDISISDASYVAIAGSVGETFIPFNFMTRTLDAAGVLHMHIDTPSVAAVGTVPITLTLLSVRPDRTVCALSVTTSVVGTTPVNAPTTSGGGAGTSVSTPETPDASNPWGASAGEKQTTAQQPEKGPWGQGMGSSVGYRVTGKTVGGPGAFDAVCNTANGATRLWTVLLAVYLLVVAATILAQPTNKPADQSTFVLGAAIVLPLLILLGIWGYAPLCRVGIWAPVGALLIAGIGFVLGFRNHPQFAQKSPADGQRTPAKSSAPTPPSKPVVPPAPKNLGQSTSSKPSTSSEPPPLLPPKK